MPRAIEALATASAAPSEGFPWLTPIIAVASLILGSGGVVAWRRLSHDRRIGVAQQETAEDDALSNRWRAIIETQTEVLLEPMKGEIAALKTEVGGLRTELADSRRKYWSAVTHIRTLYNWIARHMPDDIEATQIPAPPATLAEDI